MMATQWPSAVDSSPVTFAGRYEILSALAKGGQGVVYVALDRRSDTRVALKVVDHLFCTTREPHDRLMREAQIGNYLACENIVDVLEAGLDAQTGVSYLSMELLVGRDLQRVVASDGPLAPPVAVDYLRQVASGLDCAHQFRGCAGALPIIHRDLKPENLFLCESDDGRSVVKILDFGVAKILERHAPNSVNLRGTPLYMAVEQLTGAAVSPATDVWAFGLVAFFLLTGKPYWMAGQPHRCNLPCLFKEILTERLVSPSIRIRQLQLACSLPSPFDTWFLRCVHRNPARRFPSAGHAIRALARALEVPLAPSSMRVPPGSNWCLDFGRHSLARMATGPVQWLWLALGAVLGFVGIAAGAALVM